MSYMNHERVEILFRLEWTKHFGAIFRPKSIFPVCYPVDRENGMMIGKVKRKHAFKKINSLYKTSSISRSALKYFEININGRFLSNNR